MPQTIISEHPDPDTLGGRISRARAAMDLTTSQLARRLGVKTETVSAWEADRSEPRANRLLMVAGMMGVSPTWLLNGVGDAPDEDRFGSALHVLSMQIERLKKHQEETAATIDAIDNELKRMTRSRASDG